MTTNITNTNITNLRAWKRNRRCAASGRMGDRVAATNGHATIREAINRLVEILGGAA